MSLDLNVRHYLSHTKQVIAVAQSKLERGLAELINAPFARARASIQKAVLLVEKAKGIESEDPSHALDILELARVAAWEAYFYTLGSRKAEARGVWHRPAEKSPQEIIDALDAMQKAGFNELYLETFFGGYTIYPSSTAKAYGIEEQRPAFSGWDPLEVYVREAAKRGIGVHAWIDGGMTGVDKTGGPILRVHPEWASLERKDAGSDKPMPQSGTGYFWLDLINPQVQTYMLGLLNEMVSTYGMAGLNMDYMRFPHSSDWTQTYSFSSYACEAFEKLHGFHPLSIQGPQDSERGSLWTNWVGSMENDFIKRIYIELKAVNSQLVISSTPEPGIEADKIGEWADYIDVVIPQAYSDRTEQVRKIVEEHQALLQEGQLLYSGIYPWYVQLGPYETIRQMQVVNDQDYGTSLFSWGHAKEANLSALQHGPWREPAVSTGAHPLQAAGVMLESIRANLDEVYVPQSVMSKEIAQELRLRLDSLQQLLVVNLPWDSFESVQHELKRLHIWIAQAEEHNLLLSCLSGRLQKEINYVANLLTYSYKRRIR